MESSLRESMFGNDSTMNNLNSQEKSKIDELFSHDQNVAQQYQQNPQLSTSPSGRVLDPYARELALSNRYKGTAGDLTTIRQGQQTRRDVIGDSLANALKLAQAALDHKKYELEQLQKDREFAWEVYKEKNKSTGGGTQADKDSATYNQLVQELSKKRMTLVDAISKYGGQLDANKIYAAYTAVNTRGGQSATKSQYGAPKENPGQLASLGVLKSGTYSADDAGLGDLQSILGSNSTSSSQGTTMMISPEGKTQAILNNEVATAKKNGWRIK